MVLAFEEALRLGTGLQLDFKRWRESSNNRVRLKDQTNVISLRLEREGIHTWNAPHEPITTLGELSGRIESEFQKRRHIMLLPEVARSERSGLIRDLTYFLEHHKKGKYVRYGVLTSGNRVSFGDDLRGRRQSFHTNLTPWVD